MPGIFLILTEIDIPMNSISSLITEFDRKQFVLERFADVKKTQKQNALVHFHTVNKYLLMAHSVNELNKLGNLVANHDNRTIAEILVEYEFALNNILKNNPNKKSHSNVLFHIFGHFSKDLTSDEKKLFLNAISKYHSSLLSLSQVLQYLKNWTKKFDKTYLIRQTYFLLYVDNASD